MVLENFNRQDLIVNICNSTSDLEAPTVNRNVKIQLKLSTKIRNHLNNFALNLLDHTLSINILRRAQIFYHKDG